MRQEAARRRLDSMDIAAAADAAAGAADDTDEVRCALPFFAGTKEFHACALARSMRADTATGAARLPRGGAGRLIPQLRLSTGCCSANQLSYQHPPLKLFTPHQHILWSAHCQKTPQPQAMSTWRVAEPGWLAAWKRVSQYALKPLVDQDAPGAGLSCCLAVQRGKLHSQL